MNYLLQYTQRSLGDMLHFLVNKYNVGCETFLTAINKEPFWSIRTDKLFATINTKISWGYASLFG